MHLLQFLGPTVHSPHYMTKQIKHWGEKLDETMHTDSMEILFVWCYTSRCIHGCALVEHTNTLMYS